MRKHGIAGDPVAQGRLRERVKDREALVSAAIQDVMKTPQGRLFVTFLVHDLLGLRSVSFVPESKDSLTFFNDGRRYAAKCIEELVEKTSPDMYDMAEIERRKMKRAEREISANIENDAALTDEREMSDA